HGVPKRVDHAADHGVAHRHAEQLAGTADFVPFVDRQVIAQDDHADGVLFEVERQADHAAGKADHLARHHAGEPVHAGNAIPDLQHAAHLADVDARLVLLDLGLEDGGDFVGFEFHGILVGWAMPTILVAEVARLRAALICTPARILA